MTNKKKYLAEDEIDSFINSLYTDPNNFFDVEIPGKDVKMQFGKRISQANIKKISEMNDANEQNAMLISVLSEKPNLTFEQASKLPHDVIKAIMDAMTINQVTGFGEINNESKKKDLSMSN